MAKRSYRRYELKRPELNRLIEELLARAQPPDATETELAERFAALLDLWARDQILTQPSPSDANACCFAHA